MPVTITPGLEEGLSIVEANALDILIHLRLEEFNHLKQLMELDIPGVVGRTTLDRFVHLCSDLGFDLSKAGVNAFKEKHELGNTGALSGVIGPQTASFYFDAILEALLDGFTPGETGQEINDAGLALVKEFEGLHKKIPGEPRRVKTYIDPVGVPTIGYGHTEGVTLGQVITFDEAAVLLKEDLKDAARAVSGLVRVPMTGNQFSALVSFTFNAGAGALASSTLLKRLNEENYEAAADEFRRWVFGGGNVLPGLVRRRSAERDLFLKS